MKKQIYYVFVALAIIVGKTNVSQLSQGISQHEHYHPP
jgi:Asp-tRNA(Asn)/Glu-tRNA(Gln) amidotransferase A subunit family amidase